MFCKERENENSLMNINYELEKKILFYILKNLNSNV